MIDSELKKLDLAFNLYSTVRRRMLVSQPVNKNNTVDLDATVNIANLKDELHKDGTIFNSIASINHSIE